MPRILAFFFNDTATTEIYTLSLHDALPICPHPRHQEGVFRCAQQPQAIMMQEAQHSPSGYRQEQLVVMSWSPLLLCKQPGIRLRQIGRASCRGREKISVVAGSLKKKKSQAQRSRPALHITSAKEHKRCI